MVKETIQTRNRKSTGKSKKKGKKSLSSHLPLTPPLSAGLPVEGAGIFSGQIPRNYIVATPSGNYEQSSTPVYGEYNYTPLCYPPSGYNHLQMYSKMEKQEQNEYEEEYPNNEDVKPTITSTTSAFNVITTPPNYAANAVVSRGQESMENNMTPSDTFHASTYSAFSPFASDNSSPVGQSPTQASQSPLL